jgi:hypothetical protein
VLTLLDIDGKPPAIAIERFVVGPRAARSSTPKAGKIASEVVTFVARMADMEGLPYWTLGRRPR